MGKGNKSLLTETASAFPEGVLTNGEKLVFNAYG
jgi:hypothetical protein